MNQYPMWKNLLLLLVLAVGVIYSLPNIYAPDPAIQVSGEDSSLQVTSTELAQIEAALGSADIAYSQAEIENNRVQLISMSGQIVLDKTYTSDNIELEVHRTVAPVDNQNRKQP